MRTRPFIVAPAAAVLSSPTAAHHGWAGYEEPEFTLVGVVESANLGGPHGLLRVRSNRAVWEVVLAPPTRNARAGLTAAAVTRGTQVRALGHRHNDHRRLEMKTERLVIGNRTFNLYPERS